MHSSLLSLESPRPGQASSERQLEAFAAALLDPSKPLPPGLVGPDGVASSRRFGVYRNNVVVGLVEALKHAYPVIVRLVGNAFFSAMARIFAVRQPPLGPVMLDYGAGFAEFLAGFEPVAALPYLAAVARLERAWLEAYHAAEDSPLALDSWQALDPEDFPNLCISLHPSTRLIRSCYPVVGIWQMNIGDADPGTTIDLESGGEDALVVRPAADVTVRRLPPGAFRFTCSLAAGSPVSVATRAALEEAVQFDLASTLMGLLDAGALAGWSLPDAGPEKRP